MLPSEAPDHSSPHSPSPSANNNLPVRSSAKNTSFLHSENPSTPKHSVESYPCPKTSIIRTMCSRNFSVLINQSQKTPKIFFILSPNFAPVNNLTPIRPPGESSPSSRPPTHSPLPRNNLTPICPPGRSRPSSRPPTHSPLPHATISRRSALRADPDHSSRPPTPGSGSGVVAPAAQTGALASAACG